MKKLKLWALLILCALVAAAFIGHALADYMKPYLATIASGLVITLEVLAGVVIIGAITAAFVGLSFAYSVIHNKIIKPRADLQMELENNKITNQLREHDVKRAEHIAALFQQLAISDTANFQVKTTDLDLNVIRTLPAPHTTSYQDTDQAMISAGQQQKQLAAAAPTAPDPVDLVDIMRPAGKKVTIAFSSQGPVLVDLSRGEHLWLGGPTGKGKTTELRFLLAQIAPIAETYLLSPHYAPIKALSNGTLQDWRPIQSYLADYPARTAAELERRLKWALTEMDRRYLAEEHGDYSWRFTPIYIAIDEWPEIVARYPGASDDIGAILRRGRHVGVCVINTSQSALVKVNGGSSSDRNQYGVVVNFGLSTTEANAMRANIVNVPSTDLGNQGLVICRAGDVEPTLARVPWVSNAGLYAWMFTPDEPISDSPVNVSGANLRQQRAYAGKPEPVEPRPASTVQDDLRNTPAYRRFETLKQAGKTNKKEIILSVWGEKAGASQGYQKASALYEQFQEIYNEQLTVEAEAVTIESEM